MRHRILFALAFLWALAIPTWAQQSVIVPATTNSTPVALSTAATTLLITGLTGKSIYVTAWDVIAAGTGNIQLVAGTGATCGTSQTPLTGNYNLVAQAGIAKGIGAGAVLVAPQGFNVCAITSAAIGYAGSISYAIF